jgi:hypothetical protein
LKKGLLKKGRGGIGHFKEEGTNRELLEEEKRRNMEHWKKI